VNLEVETVRARLRSPFVSAMGSIESRELLLVRLGDGAGHVGHGEAAPLVDYDGVSVQDCHAAIEDCRPVLAQSDASDRERVLAECARLAVLPQALSAVDLALWDLLGRRLGRPVWHLLGGSAPPVVAVNHTIAAPDRAGAAAEAATARDAGFGMLKLKVGTGDDAGRLAAVRAAAGAEMGIRLDANGAWSVTEAAAALGALAPAGLELCEEAVSGLDDTRELSRLTQVRLAIDETAAAPGALDRRVCDAACLKLTRCGGVTGLIDAAERARATGYELYLASTLDGPLGIAATLHAAAVLDLDRPSGLATLALFAARANPLPALEGRLRVPDGPGLGDGLLGWYR
jgi:L-alanine-DL-glutamate epimerase-like enolase superfamily enzyme